MKKALGYVCNAATSKLGGKVLELLIAILPDNNGSLYGMCPSDPAQSHTEQSYDYSFSLFIENTAKYINSLDGEFSHLDDY